MSPDSPLASELAREMLNREMAGPASGALLPAVQSACVRLHHLLSSVLGPTGYQSLFIRALSNARDFHPALRDVSVGGVTGPWLHGLDQHDPEVASQAAIEVFTQFIELLGRFVGEPLAVRLIKTAWPDQGA